MCGIAGFYGFRNDPLLKKFSKELAHRGPDGEGIFTNEKVSLLNRRLAIIDLKTGDQPKFNDDKNLIVVYNGEIYNFRELRAELKKKNHRFHTESDTEVIIKAYEEWGDKCFNKFNGMFAIALYNTREQKLVLARDHFGIKPLFYSIIGTKLVFSSEIKPIISSGLIRKKTNDRIIYRYLKYRVHDDQEETFFSGVKKLMPGQMMTADHKGFNIKYFSNLKEELQNLSDVKMSSSNEKDDFKSKLTEAVKLRLIADVSVGTCLSGGLDSSTVVSVINHLLKKRVKEADSIGPVQQTFSAVFPGAINDEERYVDELVKTLDKVKNYKVKPDAKKFMKELNRFVLIQEEPTISTGPYAQYKVMQEVAKHVKVVLDGQGSDEMLAGYDPYYYVYLRQLIKQKKYLKFLREFFSSLDIISKYILLKAKRLLKSHNEVKLEKVLNAEFQQQYTKEKFEPINDNLKKRLIEDVFYNSLPSLLRYEDKNSMNFSIEGRVPFLDFNLIKYIFSQPDGAFIKNGWNKKVLRDSFSNLLPNSIVKRRNKIGFTTPEYDWFKKISSEIYLIFLSESFAKRKYFNRQEVLRAFELFTEGKNDDTLFFWRLINLEIWLRLYFDEDEKEVVKKTQPTIKVLGKTYERQLIKTDLFKRNDDYALKIADSILNQPKKERKWLLAVSEKIIAIAQGRSYFLWEIKPGFWAKKLSQFVKKTPSGIGLGSPWTMQLAINEIGLARILLASALSIATKPFGVEGMFYHLAGRQVAAIDGPTESSLYPSNVSAKLAPKDPELAAQHISEEILKKLKNDEKSNFQGVVLIDANDIGQNVLANTTQTDSNLIEKIFADNPMGQEKEQTPLTVVYL